MRAPAPALRRAAAIPVAAASCAVLVAACGTGGDAGAGASPPPAESGAAPSPSPSPSPTGPEEVTGEREIQVVDVDSSSLLGFPPAEPAGDAARKFGEEIAELLDLHLTDLQEGGTGALQETAPPPLAAAIGDTLPGVGDLAAPDRPIEQARYLLRVHADDQVRFAEAVVTATDATGAERVVDLGFTPGPDGSPQLSLVPAPPPPPPA